MINTNQKQVRLDRKLKAKTSEEIKVRDKTIKDNLDKLTNS